MSEEQPASHSRNGAIDWAKAVAAHRRWLTTVILSRLGNAHATEDVMQEVAVCAIQQKPVLSDAEKIPAWLYRVAVRQSLLYRRRLGRDKRRTERFAKQKLETDSQNVPQYNPLNWLLADEEQQLVREAVHNLRPKDRELLLLKYTEHWTCLELACHLGIQVTAVETRLARARHNLRRELASLNITERDR